MKKLSWFWIFFALSLFSLLGLIVSYTLGFSIVVQGGFLAGILLAVLLKKVRMGLDAIDKKP